MTKSAYMTHAGLSIFLSKTFATTRAILVTPDTVTIDEKGIQTKVSLDRVRLVPGNDKRNDGTDRNHGILGTEHEQHEDRIHQSDYMPYIE